MKVSIFGLGYVGCVTAGCLVKDGHEIIGVDVVSSKVDKLKSGRPTVIETGLDELIAEGHLPEGEIDERSIREIEPASLSGYTACHFFAGIGGWPLALRLAGWPADRPVCSLGPIAGDPACPRRTGRRRTG